ncbi:hypothetical protein ACQ4PT_060436 [Festuca glaucescens]
MAASAADSTAVTGDDAPEHGVDCRVVQQQPGPATEEEEEVVVRAQRGAHVAQAAERGHEANAAHDVRGRRLQPFRPHQLLNQDLGVEAELDPIHLAATAVAVMPRIPRRPSEEARRGAYMPPGVDTARSRRRREDRLLALRRRNRDAGLFKRRRDEPPLLPAPVGAPSEAAAPVTDGTAPPPPPSGPSAPPPAPPGADSPRTAADSELA